MFRTPAVTVILVQNLLFGYCYYAELYFLPLYFENVRGVTPLVSAALLVPLVVAQMIFSVGSGFYISHYSRYGEVIWFGFICWTVYVAPISLSLFLLCLHVMWHTVELVYFAT